MRNGEFDLVVTDDLSGVDEKVLSGAGYEVYVEQTLRSGAQMWRVRFWRSSVSGKGTGVKVSQAKSVPEIVGGA